MTGQVPPVSPIGSPKPRVLLVDDNQGILQRVSAMLAKDFDVAGAATGGRQALEAARQLDPDVIVLDVNMPEFDGFQTIQALEQAGSRAPVVFLSMGDSEQHVAKAFRCGGRGYVVKTRIARDLASALNHTFCGRMFAPSLTALSRLARNGGHAMQLHGDLECFLDALAALFDLALREGDATCVIATGDVREGLAARLRARGWDIGGPSGHKRYLFIDAAEALNTFMQNGLPDPGRLAAIAGELDEYRLAVAESESSRLTLFGNMVRLLSADANTDGIVALESLWNRLTHHLPFFTLCGYACSTFHAGVPELYSGACAEHWAVSHTSDIGEG